jgi:hypothetical protein
MNTSEIQKIKLLSFSEIINGKEAFVRMTDDGYLFVVDLVMVVTGHNRETALKTLKRLDPAMFHPDKIVERLNTQGSLTKLILFRNAIELIMILPGKTAKDLRVKFSSIIQRFLEGDQSLSIPSEEYLTSESYERNESSSAICTTLMEQHPRDSVNEMARKELKRNVDEDFEQNIHKRRKRGHDLDVSVLRIAVENKKRDLANEEMDIDIKHAKYMQTIMEVQGKIIDKYVSLCSMESIDQEATTLFKENLLKIATQSTKFMGVFSPVV